MVEDESLEAIRRSLEPIALITPQLSLSVVDIARKSKVLVTRKADSSISIFKQLFGASLSQSLICISHNKNGYALRGYFSLRGFPTKYHQYFYVNRHFMAPNEVHKLINRLFAQSKFVNQDNGPSRIGQDWDVTLQIIEDTTIDFLIRNDFMGSSLGPGDTDSSTVISEPTAPPNRWVPSFESVIPVKGAKALTFDEDECCRNLSVNKRKTTDEEPRNSKRRKIETTEDGVEYEVWTDPVSNEKVYVDTRTGNSYSRLPGAPVKMSTSDSGSVDKRGLIARKAKATSEGGISNLWAADTLKKWENPVFKGTERPVKSLALANVELGGRSFLAKASRLFGGVQADEISETIAKSDIANLQVIAQVDNKFIACKLAQPQFEKSDLLVMIDQHAADERVRLEALLANLFTARVPSRHFRGDGAEAGASDDDGSDLQVDTLTLDPPVRITMTLRETQAALRLRDHFLRWGIKISSPNLSEELNVAATSLRGPPDTHVPVVVHSLPRVIADRCVADPRVTKTLLLQHLHFLQDGGGSGGGCPKGIMDILCSKACRSAIMFGDPLTVEECRGLIDRLRKCKFPFQCAHGRPSMVPIAHMGKIMGTVGRIRGGQQKKGGVNLSVWKRL
ncbi:DNA mismatch repair protein [Borealophlyctis nickersoniae]|nr:DNA mismatch repair protein [Borealophlyctis nickersoniae]